MRVRPFASADERPRACEDCQQDLTTMIKTALDYWESMSTIMEDAKKGIVTPQFKSIAEKEKVSERFVMEGIAAGRIVAPCNPIHSPEPTAIGDGMSIKVNVNLGTSRDMVCLETELEKLRVALRYGADAVMKAYGRDYMSGLPREREITTELVNKAVAEPLEYILEAVRSVLERIPPEISADVYRGGITISGASSALGGLADYVSQSTGLRVNIAPNGATSVVDGLSLIMEDERYTHLAKPLRRTYYEND